MTGKEERFEDDDHYNENGLGIFTPWGEALGESRLAEGITLFETGGHGGIKLSSERNAAMPAGFRQPGAWYEEDCEAHKVLLVFADELDHTPDSLRISEDIVNNYWAGPLRRWKAARKPRAATRRDTE